MTDFCLLLSEIATMDFYKKVLVFVMCLAVLSNVVMHYYRPFYVKLYMITRDIDVVKELISNKLPNLMNNTAHESLYDFIIFTSFMKDHKRCVVHNNTKHNWPQLGKRVKAVLFTNDRELADEFLLAGWDVFPELNVSSYGTPVLRFMFLHVANTYRAPIIGFANADILFTDGLTDTLNTIAQHQSDKTLHFMATGRRTNIKNLTEKHAESFDSLKNASRRGVLYRADAEDYFFTDNNYPWTRVPDVVIGRVAYDNFLLLHARMLNCTTFDLSQTVLAVHQIVDNGHLEKSKRTPEFHYNNAIIKKRFSGVNYYAGMTNCLSRITVRRKGRISIEKRNKVSNYCSFRTTDTLKLKE